MNSAKNNYIHLIEYYIHNEYDIPENDPPGVLESIKLDEYNEQAVGGIYDALNDEYMLSDFSTGLIKDMFMYYCKHGKNYSPSV